MTARRLGVIFGLIVLALPLLAGADRGSSVLVAQVPMYFPLATSTPLVITNTQDQATSEAPSWLFKSTSSTGCTSTSNGLAYVVQFWNSSQAVLDIPCATSGSGSNVQAEGLSIVGGQGFINETLPTPIPSPTAIPLPMCAAGGASPIVENDCRGLVPPTYTFTGYPATSTFHCVYGSVLASSATSTVTLTNSSVFGTSPTEVSGVDSTAGTVVPTTAFTSVGTSSITFTTVSAHTYYLHLCGY